MLELVLLYTSRQTVFTEILKPKDIILCLIAIKTITAFKKVINIIYGFKDNKQIISQLQFLLGFKISVKTVCLSLFKLV
jgi:hypothetical protein